MRKQTEEKKNTTLNLQFCTRKDEIKFVRKFQVCTH